MDKKRRAGYSKKAKQEKLSIITLDGLLNGEEFYSYLSHNDKTPNYDGYIELLDELGQPFGKVEVQVKTLNKKYKTPSLSINHKYFNYVKDAGQLPFIFILVDTNNEKAFWKYISKNLSETVLREEEILKTGKKSTSLKFHLEDEIGENSPYKKWRDIIVKYRDSISGMFEPTAIEIPTDSNLPYIDQVHSFFQTLYREVNYLPAHLLSSAKPIFGRGYRGTYFDIFTLETGNKELFELMSNFSGDAADNRLKFIVDKLVLNNVRQLSHRHEKIELSKIRGERICNCLQCRLNKLDFRSVNTELQIDEKDLASTIQKAYINYELGNYEKAARLYLNAEFLANRENNGLTLFFIRYSQSKLYLLLRNRYYLDGDQPEVMMQLGGVNPNSEFRKYDDDQFFPLVNWLYRERYLESAKQKVSETVEKIIAQYHSSLRGGISLNGFKESLFKEIANVNSFLNRNYVVYNKFNEFTNLIDRFAEGLYASHAIKPNRDSSKLDWFNGWLFFLLIEYATPEQLIVIFKRYKHRFLIFKDSEPNRIEGYILGLIDKLKDAIMLEGFLEPNNESFITGQRRKIRCAIVIVSQADFGSIFIRKVSRAITTYVADFGAYQDQRFVEYFYARKKKDLLVSNFKQIIWTSFNQPHFHSQYYFESISSSIRLSQKFISFTENQFEKIIMYVTEKCQDCNKIHDASFLVSIYNIIQDQEQRNTITNLIHNKLENKFDYRLLSNAVIFDVIKLGNSYLSKLIQESKPRIVTKGKIQTVNRGKPNERYAELGSLINLCFKENINLLNSEFDILRGRSPYYDWLLNMDDFDYSLFQPEWISEYGTIFYFEKMYHSKPLKLKLEEFLASEDSYHAQEVMNDYLNIYVRKSWEKQLKKDRRD